MKNKSYKNGIRYLVILPFLMTITFASNTKELLKVTNAVEIALQKNPDLAKIKKRYEALEEVPSQVQSLPDPVLSVGAINFPTDTFDKEQEPMTSIQVGFSQDFPYPGKLDLRAQVAKFVASAASYSVEEAKLILSNHIVTSWWQMYYLDHAVQTIINNQVLLRQFIQVAQEKYKTGKGLQQDVLLAQLELSKLIDQEIQVNALRRKQQINLNLLMGRDPSLDIHLGENTKQQLSPKMDEKYLYKLAQEYRPSLKREKSNILAATSRLSLAKQGYYPDFKFSVAYSDRNGYNSGTIDYPRSDLFSIKVGIKVPLYYRTKQSKAVRQKFIEERESYFALEDEKFNVMAEISNYYISYQQAKKQLSLYETGILPQARQTVESMLSGYQVNKVDFLNLVRSQVTLFNYELIYWKALAESMQALSGIQSTVGKVNIYE